MLDFLADRCATIQAGGGISLRRVKQFGINEKPDGYWYDEISCYFVPPELHLNAYYDDVDVYELPSDYQ